MKINHHEFDDDEEIDQVIMNKLLNGEYPNRKVIPWLTHQFEFIEKDGKKAGLKIVAIRLWWEGPALTKEELNGVAPETA